MTLPELHDMLVMWGRWSRQDEPPGGFQLSRIFADWLPSQWWKDAGEDCPVAIEAREAEPDEPACIALERVIAGLQRRHRGWLVQRYVREQYVADLELGAAHRALMDRL